MARQLQASLGATEHQKEPTSRFLCQVYMLYGPNECSLQSRIVSKQQCQVKPPNMPDYYYY